MNIRKYLQLSINKKVYQYILSVLIIGGTALICSPLSNSYNYHIVSFIMLFVVFILSMILSVGPVLLSSTLSALAWNYLFIPPHFTFKIEKTEDILIFGLFFIIALTNGVFTTRVRRQEKLARDRERRTNALFQLTKELTKASGIDEVLKIGITEIKNHFFLDSFFILQDGHNRLNSTGRLQKDKKLSSIEYNVAEWVFEHQQIAGAFTENISTVEYTFFPLKGTRLNPGIVAIRFSSPLLYEQVSYWDTFLTQISNALEREFLGEMAQKVRFLDESDRLYKTLFNSISHELRIPVATIMGASDSILNSTNPERVQEALCQEIFTASLRLNRLIENLLNISRLESGHISVRLDWYDINDLINKVIVDLSDELKPFTMKVSIPEEMPLVRIDFGLMEQVLYNLLFNATQYSPGASDIVINVDYKDQLLIIDLTDCGPGFPETEIKNVFKKFFRVDGSKTGGLGLGLSIVKGFIDAHNGTISVQNRINGGSRFIISIPTEKPDIKIL